MARIDHIKNYEYSVYLSKRIMINLWETRTYSNYPFGAIFFIFTFIADNFKYSVLGTQKGFSRALQN